MSWLSEGEGLHGVRSDISPSLHSPDSVSLAGVLDLQSGKTLITLFKNNSIGKKIAQNLLIQLKNIIIESSQALIVLVAFFVKARYQC